MNPLPPPHVAGKTEWERFNNAVRKIIHAPKQVVVKPEDKQEPKAQIASGARCKER
jgi:hypothetical protein